jgi:hypothetical protein
MDEGSPHVVRDGRDQGGFTFGGGVVDAVQGNPRAENEARKGRNLVIGGFVVALGGLAVETGGLVYILSAPRDDRDANVSTGLGIVLGGATIAFAGSLLSLNGQPHLYDAINIYNDDLEAARAQPVRPPAPLPVAPTALPPASPPALPPAPPPPAP